MKKFFTLILLVLILIWSISSIKFLVRAEDKSIFINEFLPDGIGSDSGKEWVELYNLADHDINLKDWKILTKSATSTTPRATLIGDVVIKARSFFIITEFDILDVDYLNVGSGKLNMYNSNAEIYILDSGGNKVDTLNYILTQEGKSLERKGPLDFGECSSLQISVQSTLGKENISKDLNCWPTNLPVSAPNLDNGEGVQPETPEENLPDINNPDSELEVPDNQDDSSESKLGAQSSIVISEAYPSPNKNLNENEWLEIYNQDILGVELTGMYLKERAGEGMGSSKTMLPNVTLDPGEYLVIYEKDIKLSLNNSGDIIYLFDVNDMIVDNFKFGSIATSNSAARKFENNLYQKVYSNDQNLNLVPATTIPTPGYRNEFPISKKVSISDLPKLNTGELVKVAGVVNSDLNFIEKDTFYLQDKDSGIRVYLGFESAGMLLKAGNKIDATGILKLENDGDMYLQVYGSEDIRLIDDTADINVKSLEDVDNYAAYLNTVCSLSGQISKNYGTTFYITSEGKSVKVKVISNSNITLPSKSIGDTVKVEGLLILDNDLFTIIPLYPKSLEIFSEEEIKNTKSKKILESSTPSALNVLGESAIDTNFLATKENLQNIGDKLYRADSPPTQESKIYPWPLYFASSSLAILEFIKTLAKAVKYF